MPAITPYLLPLLADGNSRAARSFRARLQWRDRKGRWIPMFGAMSFLLMRNGRPYEIRGTFVGVASDPNFGWVHVDAKEAKAKGIKPGYYKIDKASGEAIEEGVATLPDEALYRAGIDPNANADKYAVAGARKAIPEAELSKAGPFEAPEGWQMRTQESNGLPALRSLDNTLEIRERRSTDDKAFYEVEDLTTGETKQAANIGDAHRAANELDQKAVGGDQSPIEAFKDDNSGDLTDEAKALEQATAPRRSGDGTRDVTETPDGVDEPDPTPGARDENAPEAEPEREQAEKPDTAARAEEIREQLAEKEAYDNLYLSSDDQNSEVGSYEKNENGTWTSQETGDVFMPRDLSNLLAEQEANGGPTISKFSSDKPARKPRAARKPKAEPAERAPEPEAPEEAPDEPREAPDAPEADAPAPDAEKTSRLDDLLTQAEIDAADTPTRTPAPTGRPNPDDAKAIEAAHAKRSRENLKKRSKAEQQAYMAGRRAYERGTEYDYGIAAEKYMERRRRAGTGAATDEDRFIDGWLDNAADLPVGSAFDPDGRELADSVGRAPNSPEAISPERRDMLMDRVFGEPTASDLIGRTAPPRPDRTPLERPTESDRSTSAQEMRDRIAQIQRDVAAGRDMTRINNEAPGRFRQDPWSDEDRTAARRVAESGPFRGGETPAQRAAKAQTKDELRDLEAQMIREVGERNLRGRAATQARDEVSDAINSRWRAIDAGVPAEETDAQRATREGAEAETAARAERRRDRDFAVDELDNDRFAQRVRDAADTEGTPISDGELRRGLNIDEIVDLARADTPPTDREIDDAFQKADMFLGDLDSNGMLSRDAGGELTRDLQGYRDAIKAEAADRRADTLDVPRAETPDLLEGIEDAPEPDLPARTAPDDRERDLDDLRRRIAGETDETPGDVTPEGDPVDEIDPVDANDDDSDGFTPDPEKPWQVSGKDAAEVYDDLESDFDDPEVQASYEALKENILAQYMWMTSDPDGPGLTVDLSNSNDPYAGAKDMARDVDENRHLAAFADNGAGLAPNHPMNQWVSVNGERVHLNDLFRAVHDYMGHIGARDRGATLGFGEKGEWEAWRTHRQTLPRESWMALWTETRGQNTWTNYAGDNWKRAKDDPNFGEQKAGRVAEDMYAADLIGDEDETFEPWAERVANVRDWDAENPAWAASERLESALQTALWRNGKTADQIEQIFSRNDLDSLLNEVRETGKSKDLVRVVGQVAQRNGVGSAMRGPLDDMRDAMRTRRARRAPEAPETPENAPETREDAPEAPESRDVTPDEAPEAPEEVIPEPEEAPEAPAAPENDVAGPLNRFREVTDDLIGAMEATDLADLPSTDEAKRAEDVAALRESISNPDLLSNAALNGMIRRYGFDKEAAQEWRAAREAFREAVTGDVPANEAPNRRIRDAAAAGDKDQGIEDVLQAAETAAAADSPAPEPTLPTMRERFKLRKQRGFSERRTTPISEREQEIFDEITAMDNSTDEIPDYLERRKALQDELQALSKAATQAGRRPRDNAARQAVRDERRQAERERAAEETVPGITDDAIGTGDTGFGGFATGRGDAPSPERIQELQGEIARTDIPDGNRIVTVLPDGAPLVYERRGGQWRKVAGPETERSTLPDNADLAGTPFGRGQTAFLEGRMRPLTREQMDRIPEGGSVMYGNADTPVVATKIDATRWIDSTGDVIDVDDMRDPRPLWNRARAERGPDALARSTVTTPERRQAPAPAPERAPEARTQPTRPMPERRDPLERDDLVTPTRPRDSVEDAARDADEISEYDGRSNEILEPETNEPAPVYGLTEQGAVTNDRDWNKRVRKIMERLTERAPGFRRHQKNSTATQEGQVLANEIRNRKGRLKDVRAYSTDVAEEMLQEHGFDRRMLQDFIERSNNGRGESFLTDDKKQKIVSSVYAAAYQRMVEEVAGMPAGPDRDRAAARAAATYQALKKQIDPALFGQSTWQESVLRDLDVAKTLIRTRAIGTDMQDFYEKMATLPGQSAAGRRHLIDHLRTLPGADPDEVIEKIQYWEKSTRILSMTPEEVLRSRASIERPDDIQRHILEEFPNAAIMPNGDTVIGEHLDTRTNTLYQAVISRSSDGRFQTGVVSVNGDTGEAHYRSITKGAQSIRALEGNIAHFGPLFSTDGGRESLGSFMREDGATTMRIDLGKFFAPGGRSMGAFLTKPRYFADDEKQAKAEMVRDLLHANPDATNAAIVRAAMERGVSGYFARQALSAVRDSIIERMSSDGRNVDTHIDTLGQRLKEGDWVDYTFRRPGHELDGQVFRGQIRGFAKSTSNRGSYAFEDDVKFESRELRDALNAVRNAEAIRNGDPFVPRRDKTFQYTAGNVLKVDGEYSPLSEPFDGEHTRLMVNLGNDHLENMRDIMQNPDAAAKRMRVREAQNVDYDPIVDVSMSPKVSGLTRHHFDSLIQRAATAPTEEIRAGDLKDGDAIAILNEKTGKPEFVVVYNVRHDPERGIVEFDSYSPKENLRGELLRQGMRVRDSVPVPRKQVGAPSEEPASYSERMRIAKRLIEAARLSDAERADLLDEVWPKVSRDIDMAANLPSKERLDEIIDDLRSRREIEEVEERPELPQEAQADEAAVQAIRTTARAAGVTVPSRLTSLPRATTARRGEVSVRPKDIRTRGARANVRRVDGQEIVVGDLVPVMTYKREKNGSISRKPGYLRVVETNGRVDGTRAVVMAPEEGYGLRDPRSGRINLKDGSEIDFTGENRKRWNQTRYRSTGIEGYDDAVSGLTRDPEDPQRLVWEGLRNPQTVSNILLTNRFGDGFTVLPDGSPARQGYVIGDGGNAPENRVRANRSPSSISEWLRERVSAYPDADGYGIWRDGNDLVFDPVTFLAYDGADGKNLERARAIAAERGEEAFYSFERGENIPTVRPADPDPDPTPDGDGPDGGDGGPGGGGGAPDAPAPTTGGGVRPTVRPTGDAMTNGNRDENGIWNLDTDNPDEVMQMTEEFYADKGILDQYAERLGGSVDQFFSGRQQMAFHVQEMLGLNAARPDIVSYDEWQEMVRNDQIDPVFRGLRTRKTYEGDLVQDADDMMRQFREDDLFPGQGVFGTGTYVGMPSEGYGFSDGPEHIMLMGVKPDANIINYQDLVDKQIEAIQALRRHPDYPGPGGTMGDIGPDQARILEQRMLLKDEGTFAMMLGYDGVYVKDRNLDGVSGSYLMFNRGAMVYADVVDPFESVDELLSDTFLDRIRGEGEYDDDFLDFAERIQAEQAARARGVGQDIGADVDTPVGQAPAVEAPAAAPAA